MKVENIRISITDQDLNELIRSRFPDNAPVRDLAACVQRDGIAVTGKCSVKFVPIRFEAILCPRADGGVLVVELANLKAVGPLGNALKGVLMSFARDALSEVPGVDGDGNEIRFDFRDLLASKGIVCEFESMCVQTHSGTLTLELSGLVRLT